MKKKLIYLKNFKIASQLLKFSHNIFFNNEITFISHRLRLTPSVTHVGSHGRLQVFVAQIPLPVNPAPASVTETLSFLRGGHEESDKVK